MVRIDLAVLAFELRDHMLKPPGKMVGDKRYSSEDKQSMNENDLGVLNHLPEEIAYLAGPALKYGVIHFEGEIIDFLDSASQEQLKESEVVAGRVKSGKHYPIVNEWLNEYKMTEYEQAAHLNFLFLMLDHAGLQFE